MGCGGMQAASGRRAGDLINIAAERGIIYKSDKKKYHYNGLKEMPKDNSQDLPFDGPSGEESPYWFGKTNNLGNFAEIDIELRLHRWRYASRA